MKRTVFFPLAALLLTLLPCCAQMPPAERAARLEEQGRFREAAAILTEAIDGATEDERATLEFELDRLRRIRLDYSLTRPMMFKALQRGLTAITPEEFDRWIAEGRFDVRTIDDTLYFADVSYRNLFWRYPELAPRRVPPRDKSAVEHHMLAVARAIKAASAAAETPYVLPTRLSVTMIVSADPNAAPAGETVRAWLPFPRLYPFQRDIVFLASSVPVLNLAEESSPLRAVYLEQTAVQDSPTAFRIDYEFTSYGVFFSLDPTSVTAYDPADPVFKEFTRESPHVVFTERIRAVSDSIIGAETNPLLKAKRIHDWMSENLVYSYAIEYSTIRNISDYCLTKRYGDCGQHALLFITLCRFNGIPARWQSGWDVFPGWEDMHDWTEISIPPYGWIPVDPDMGVMAYRHFASLTPEERKEMRDFFFGGLLQYRIAANSDHNQLLSPPKRTMRSDNVDFQRGEMEYGNTNLYFDKRSYGLTVKEVPLPR